jgi:DnaJ-class molecular chaperone
MVCKVTQDGKITCREPRKGNMHTCLTCDGAGLVESNNRHGTNLCKACNGHGVIAYDRINNRVIEFTKTTEQMEAERILNES